MEKKHNIVYEIENRANRNSYIGVHKTDNLADGYMGSGVIIKRAIAKYGIENFNKKVLFDFPTYAEALEKEKEIVNTEFLNRRDTYNLRRGGSGGFDYINRHGLQNTELNHERRMERLPKMAQGFRLHLSDPEFHEKLRMNGIKAAQQQKVLYPNGVWFGKRHSQESKNKISAKMKGKRTTSTLGKHWFTNGVDSIVAEDCPKGWRKGRICSKQQSK